MPNPRSRPPKGNRTPATRKIPARTLSSAPRKPSLSRPLETKGPRWRRLFRRRKFVFTWKKLFFFFLGLFGLSVLALTGIFAYYVRQLPNPRELQAPPVQSTQILDRNGKNLYSIYGDQNRTVVKSEDISPYLKEATIAIEDANFYQHHGFDLKGISRAVLVRLHLLTDRAGGGGSTITQQYIKKTEVGSAQTLDRKLRELILSVEAEQIYSKEEILTGYLNIIPYGSSAYGIEAASQTYFSKHAKDLTLSEAATLAAIPNAPTYYSPYGNHLDDLFTRKDLVLDRMVETGAISKADAAKAKKEAPSKESPTFRRQDNLLAPHFVFYVREQAAKLLSDSPQDAEKMLDEGGYTITTSLDLDTQNLAQKIVSDMGPAAVKKYNATNAALVAVDPKTGEVLAMVGSIDYNNSKSGNTNFANALLQPGSSFKPIVYGTAFGPKYKYSPSSILFDLPTDFGGGYKPNDFDGQFRGPITIRQALDGSLNIPAVKMLYLVGVDQAIANAKAMGITTLDQDPSQYGLSLVLGSGEVRPVEMAGAYATFANGGMHNPIRPILKIVKDGKTVKDFTSTPAQKALEPETAYEINNVLSDNNARAYIFGAHSPLTLPDRPVAAKTGTTENFRDGWTIGYTPSVSVAVWVGNNDPNKTMVKGVDGVVVAAPIWNAFMKEYLKGKPVEQFSRPATVKDVTVDKLSGKLPTDQSPADQHLTDIFAPWQVPTDSDNVHIKVKLDKASGKLATDQTPADQVMEQTYFFVHSEAPDKPGWEQPVQDWLKANGGGVAPPTEKDDVHTDANRPTVSLTSPVANAQVSGSFAITAVPGGPRPIQKVEFFVNNVSIGAATSAPWSVTYDASSLSPGSQVVQATVTNDLELTASDQVTVTVGAAAQPPGNVVSVSTIDGHKLTNKPIHLNWVNPADSDLASVSIYQSNSNDPADLGIKVQSLAATPSSNGSADIDVSSLITGKTYYFLLRPVSGTGKENTSTTKVSATVQP